MLLSAVRAEDIDRQRRAPGSSSAAARGRSTALSSKCGQCHVDSRINKAELGLLSILGHIKVFAVFTACVEFVSGWQHARNYIYIDALSGLDLDGLTDKNLTYFVVKNLATLATLVSSRSLPLPFSASPFPLLSPIRVSPTVVPLQ